MTVREILLSRRSAVRIALLIFGFAAYQFLPATQASTAGDVTVIRYSWAKTGILTALAAWAALGSLYSSYKNNTEEPRWQLAAFGAILVGLIVYIVPGVMLSKVIIEPQGITFADRRMWRDETAVLPLANANSVLLRITHVKEKWTPRNVQTPRNHVVVSYDDGSSKNAIDLGLLDPYGIAALQKLSENLGFVLLDNRRKLP